MTFGDLLAAARKAVHLSGDKLGEACGVSKQTISHWEKNRYVPDLRHIITMCDLLLVSADDLIFGKKTISPAATRVAEAWQALTPEAKKKFENLWNILFAEAPSATKRSGGVTSHGAPKRKEHATWSNKPKPPPGGL